MAFSCLMPTSILCVCLGNICRSPAAEAVLAQKIAIAGMSIEVDSAGTGDWHIGHAPDSRMQKHAKARGYNLAKMVARQVIPDDFYRFDIIMAMDSNNLANLQKMAVQLPAIDPNGQPQARLVLFSEEDPNYCGQSVPDPYYGTAENFEQVLDQIESSADAWINAWHC